MGLARARDRAYEKRPLVVEYNLTLFWIEAVEKLSFYGLYGLGVVALGRG
jgi:hypothetical protein